MEIRYITDKGLKRENNQDFVAVYYNQKKRPLVVLADGMGGHKAGDVASKMATTTLGEFWEHSTYDTPQEVADFLTQRIQFINEEIFNEGLGNTSLQGMGTTIVCAALFDETFTLAHVGDSRAYLIREDQILQITEDHSLVNDLLKAGELTDEEAIHHPRKNVITRSVGMPGGVEVDVTAQQWQIDDYLLLASDGLTDMVHDEAILTILKNGGTVTEKIGWLRDLANSNGGKDNISILIVRFERGEQND